MSGLVGHGISADLGGTVSGRHGVFDLLGQLSTRVYHTNTHGDFCTLFRVLKRVRKSTNSVLYTNVDCDNVQYAMKCLQTLSRSDALADEVGVLSVHPDGLRATRGLGRGAGLRRKEGAAGFGED